MSAFVFVEPNPFTGTLRDFTSYIPQYTATSATGIKIPDAGGSADRAATQYELQNVSRPLTGITVKPNTHAFVQVIDATGKILKVFNNLGGGSATAGSYSAVKGEADKSLLGSVADIVAGTTNPFSAGKDEKKTGGINPEATVWTDWLLQSVAEERVEKTQILETFGQDYFYAFGEKPRVLQVSGLLLNSADYNWRAVFWENWDRFFRATRLIERNARMYLSFDDIIVEGYPLNAMASQMAGNDNQIAFRFSFFITNYTNLSAQNGFQDMRTLNVTGNLIRGGYQDTSRIPQLIDSRKSVIEMLGYKGFSTVGRKAEDTIRMINGTPEGEDDPAAAQAGSLVANVLSLAASGVMATTAGKASAVEFLRAFTLRAVYEGLQYGVNTKVSAIEKEAGLKAGEINQWFGLVASILNNLNGSDFKAISGKLSGGPMFELLKLGSIDRIVQGMAYNLAAGVTSGLEDPKPGTASKIPLDKIEHHGGLGVSIG